MKSYFALSIFNCTANFQNNDILLAPDFMDSQRSQINATVLQIVFYQSVNYWPLHPDTAFGPLKK